MIAVYPVVDAVANRTQIQEYKRLLQAEPSNATHHDILDLLRQMIADSVPKEGNAWQPVLAPASNGRSARAVESTVVERIRELAALVRELALPDVPTSFPATKAHQARTLAERSWTFLVLQTMMRIEGESGVFRDAQSLLFYSSLHFLLPKLKDHGQLSEHDCLLNALHLHAVLVWRDDPAHCMYLQSGVMDYLGVAERRLELLEAAFRLTSVHDHSYLTKATAYWSDLMDLGRHEQALEFLMELNRASLLEHQDEIREMIQETAVGRMNRGAPKDSHRVIT